MKIIKTLFTIFCTIVLLSCQNGGEGIDGVSNTPFSVNIDNENFTSNTISGILNNSRTMMTISASQNGKSFILTIGNNQSGAEQLALGSYSSDINGFDNASISYSTNNTTYITEFGFDREIIITAIDFEERKISGTFNGTVVNFGVDSSFSISNGSFENVSFTLQ